MIALSLTNHNHEKRVLICLQHVYYFSLAKNNFWIDAAPFIGASTVFITFRQLLFCFRRMKLLDNLTHFANNTSIHGLVHIAKKSSSTAKRIAWLIIFILSMLYAGIQIGFEIECKYITQLYTDHIISFSLCTVW